MNKKPFFYTLGIISFIYIVSVITSGCAQIGAPTGGPKDTLAPRLVNSTPKINSTNFTGNKITLSFNEYVEIKDVQNNVLVSPFQKNNPVIDYKLKTVTIKLKDSLLPNTTYSINFGNSITDINEGNIFRDFTYTFSTGSHIDSFSLAGTVTLAETGKVDSSLQVLLYRNSSDSAVQKRKPDYLARVRGDGSFMFNNLPGDKFKVYALKDGDGSKTYNSKIEMFAFTDPVIVSANSPEVTLSAYAEQKDTRRSTPAIKLAPAKRLIYSLGGGQQNQDLLTPFEISFNTPIKKFDATKIILTDTNNIPLQNSLPLLDSSRKKMRIAMKWVPDTKYRLIIPKDALTDSLGNSLTKNDTIRFSTKRESDYGKLLLRFANLDLGKNPVIQFVQGEEIKESFPITATEWSKTLFTPGEYEIRILYDKNKNGIWDPGNYSKKLQPEQVIVFPQKLSIKSDWENEREIKL